MPSASAWGFRPIAAAPMRTGWHAFADRHIVSTGRTSWRPVCTAHPPSLDAMASQSIPALRQSNRDARPTLCAEGLIRFLI